ncbi:MAG: hypothetical protein J7J20_04070 [Desulfurococcales archaeon]|nr:hypothetical protein [Desulfurococcales archaeon]
MVRIDPRLCILCRGGKALCGYAYCPIIAEAMASIKVKKISGRKEFFGSSPPSVFVGRFGYPEVLAGPSAPPVVGDTSIYDLPEKWLVLPIEKILDYRLSLVTARQRVKVSDISKSRLIELLHELVLSVRPIEVEVELLKPPKPIVRLSEYEAPQGPTAPLKNFRIVGSGASARVIESVYSDADMRATSAIIKLYRYGVPITHIQRMLSVGALGRGRRRRLVPTRWSITAVDDTVSKYLIKKVKDLPVISEYRVYVRKHAKNLFLAILTPRHWSFEWMEAWYPNSTWNPGEGEVSIEGDYEGFRGRRTYASIGGCYYAARLATAEHLLSVGRQATAVVLREIYPGFNIPVGVWFVRENLRAMFRAGLIAKVSTFEEVVELINKYTDLGANTWLTKSRLIKYLTCSRSLTDYVGIGEAY